MVRWRCYYHAVWAVKNREPLLDEASFPRVRTYILNQRTHHTDKNVIETLELNS